MAFSAAQIADKQAKEGNKAQGEPIECQFMFGIGTIGETALHTLNEGFLQR